jgi:flagellar hook-basal body complex protein FliE
MKLAIDSVSMWTPTQQVQSATTKQTSPVTSYEAQQSFATSLKEAIANVNNQQIQSDDLTTKLINGEDVDLHEVMIGAQKASITLSATMEIRNKAVEAYQEMMRMQI